MRALAALALPAALALSLVPAASACHPSAGGVAAGAVVQGGVPVLADAWFGTCDGPVPVVVTLHTLGGPVELEFSADLHIIGGSPLGADCLLDGTCSPFYPPAAAFEITTADDSLYLAGTLENGAHLGVLLTAAGHVLGDPAAFQAAYA